MMLFIKNPRLSIKFPSVSKNFETIVVFSSIIFRDFSYHTLDIAVYKCPWLNNLVLENIPTLFIVCPWDLLMVRQ